MQTDDRWKIDRLNDVLDQATSVGDPASLAAEIAELAAAHVQLQKIDETPGPDPAFVNRLKEELMPSSALAMADCPRISLDRLNGRSEQVVPLKHAPSLRPRIERRFIAQFLTAAMILVALGTAYFGYGVGKRDGGGAPTKSAAFASAATAIPAPTISNERTLAEYDIPASALTPGIAGSAISHFILPASSTSTWVVPQEAQVHYVLDGALTLTSDKPIEVRRGASGGTVQTAPPGTPLDIGVGDSVLIGSSAITTYVNHAPAPVLMLTWGMNAGSGGSPPFPDSWNPDIYDLSGAGAINLPAGGAHIRLWQVQLNPNQLMKPPKNTVIQQAFAIQKSAAGDFTQPSLFRREADGSIFNLSKESMTVYVATLTSSGGAVGSPVSASPTS